MKRNFKAEKTLTETDGVGTRHRNKFGRRAKDVRARLIYILSLLLKKMDVKNTVTCKVLISLYL